jgi:hypothetical protein
MARQLEAKARQHDLAAAGRIYQQLETAIPALVETLRTFGALPSGRFKGREAVRK